MKKLYDFCNRYFWYLFAGLLGLVVFLSFFRLGAAPVADWDEARHGVNAYEMIKEHNLIANYYGGALDYWNLKPPLSYYFVMLGYAIFGYNAWGLRCFSALSYVALVAVTAIFLRKKFNGLSALLSMLLYAGCFILFASHCVRTGDADALFLLFIGVGVISLYLSSDNPNWLHLTGGCLALAFLTKSYHAVILVPIILGYLLATRGFRQIKGWQYATIGVTTLALPVAWLVARVVFDGWKFITDMVVVDVFNRSLHALEGHAANNWWMYLIGWAIGLGVLGGGLLPKLRKRQLWTRLDWLAAISFLAIMVLYTVAQTKLWWYLYPIAVPLIIFAAVNAVELLLSENVKAVAKYCVWGGVALVVVAGVVVSGVLVIRQTCETNELQVMIRELPADAGARYYVANGGQTGLGQGDFLVFEWQTGQLVTDGGVDAFQGDHRAYLIANRTDAAGVTDATTVAESTHYVIYYRE